MPSYSKKSYSAPPDYHRRGNSVVFSLAAAATAPAAVMLPLAPSAAMLAEVPNDLLLGELLGGAVAGPSCWLSPPVT